MHHVHALLTVAALAFALAGCGGGSSASASQSAASSGDEAPMSEREACGRATDCCLAAEREGLSCNLPEVLGGRTVDSCTAGLGHARALFTDGGAELPAACR